MREGREAAPDIREADWGAGDALRVCLITGPPESGRCGIHDYVGQLALALERAEGVDPEVLLHADWSARGTVRLLRRVRAMRPDIVHMQYPMIVGWRSVGPQALGFLCRGAQVVTLHEFSSFTTLRRASIGAFAASAKRLVFTTEQERNIFSATFGAAGRKAVVVPIGSNIPFLPYLRDVDPVVVHFGQIKPGRGLEDFVRLAELANEKAAGWRFRVVGAPVAWASGFIAEMRRRMEAAGVEWRTDVGDHEVAEALRGAAAAYLPYPDGVSERRGSLIAALGNGVPVVTTRGPFVTKELQNVVRFAESPEQAYGEIDELVCRPAKAEAQRLAASRYVTRFDWAHIADAYRAIYRQACGLAE